EPLSADNPIIFAAAPLIDTGLPTDARTALAAKSPLTGFIGDSMVSGDLGAAVKRAGFDALVLFGACPEFSILIIDGGRARREPAAHTLGRSPAETEAGVQAHLGGGYAVASIGIAGERQVRFASVVHQGRHAGRTGLGAVFGAKRLKAIAIDGDMRVKVADPAGVARAAADWAARVAGPGTEKYRRGGTASNLPH